MKILVIGNPRSGTLSMTNMLRAAGHDVKHEKLGPDGTVSCFFFLPARWYPREKTTANRHLRDNFSKFKPDKVIHLVRNPLECIPSMAKVCGKGHQQWLDEHGIYPIVKPKLLWAACAWYWTNKHMEGVAALTQTRIQIERVKKQWPAYLNPIVEVKHQHKSSGNRKSEKVTWAQLKKVCKDNGFNKLYDNLRLMSKRYGYK